MIYEPRTIDYEKWFSHGIAWPDMPWYVKRFHAWCFDKGVNHD